MLIAFAAAVLLRPFYCQRYRQMVQTKPFGAHQFSIARMKLPRYMQ